MSIADILLNVSMAFFLFLVICGLSGSIKYTGLLGLITVTVLFYGFRVIEPGEASLFILGIVSGAGVANFLRLD